MQRQHICNAIKKSLRINISPHRSCTPLLTARQLGYKIDGEDCSSPSAETSPHPGDSGIAAFVGCDSYFPLAGSNSILMGLVGS